MRAGGAISTLRTRRPVGVTDAPARRPTGPPPKAGPGLLLGPSDPRAPWALGEAAARSRLACPCSPIPANALESGTDPLLCGGEGFPRHPADTTAVSRSRSQRPPRLSRKRQDPEADAWGRGGPGLGSWGVLSLQTPAADAPHTTFALWLMMMVGTSSRICSIH